MTFFSDLQDSFAQTFFPVQTMPKGYPFAFLFLGHGIHVDQRENSPTKGKESEYVKVVPINHHQSFNGQELLLSPKAINTQINNAVKDEKFGIGDVILIQYEGDKKSPQDPSRTYKSIRLSSWVRSDKMVEAGKTSEPIIDMYHDEGSDSFDNFVSEATTKNHEFLKNKGIEMDDFASSVESSEPKEGSPDDLNL